ncbi:MULTISPECIES: hypothetical protein [unclassified Carboxylicivirga]|uniref:hypothetical protein n=1 Tax=Carboxylicivirga TaxID=1628153 RepID=UPI003D33131C
MKQGRRRTMSICLSDIKENAAHKIVKAGNGKLYLPIETYDYDEPDRFDNDFSVSVSLSKEEIEAKRSGQQVMRVFIGNGRIWEDLQAQPPTQDDIDDLPF